VVAPAAASANATAWFRPHETELSFDGPGLQVTVQAVLNQGGLVHVEARAEDGATFEVDIPRALSPTGLGAGVQMRLRPRRVFVFGEGK
jgi:hypothetical protein